MAPPVERDHLAEFGAAVAAYLNVIAAAADCLEQAYPDVGAPYRQRIKSLRARLAFDPTRESLKNSAQTIEGELKDYASVANRILTHRSVELKSAILSLSDMIEGLTERQADFNTRLRHFADRIEATPYPQDAGSFAELGARRAALLRELVGDIEQDAASTLAQMRQQMREMDKRLAGSSSTDAVTGLVNRRELERQIDAHRLHGTTFYILLFEIRGPLSDQVMRQAGATLATSFRHTDWVGRWSEKEFAVLFLGTQELARARAAAGTVALSGNYTLDNGEKVLIGADVRVVQPELVAA